MITKNGFIAEIKRLFSFAEIILSILFAFLTHVLFFGFVTSNMVFSISIAVVGTIYFLLVFIIPNRRLKTYQNNLNELMKYVTNMTYLLKSGRTVMYALEGSVVTVNDEVAKDIQKTIDTLEKDAVLDTEHFSKYEFPSLDQFHQSLKIKYEEGGESEKLFERIQKDIIFELKKRDELYRKRKGFALSIYLLTAISLFMMPIMKVNVSEQWSFFIHDYAAAGLSIISFVYLFAIGNLYLLQRHNLDISVRV